jgi:cysteine desulfurase
MKRLQSCGTESTTTPSADSRVYRDKRHIITSKVEHPAVLNLCRKLEKEGYRVSYVPLDREGDARHGIFCALGR